MGLNATLGPNGWEVDPITGVPVLSEVNKLTGGSVFSAGGNSFEFARRNFGQVRKGFPLCAALTADSGLTFVGQSGNAPTVEYIERDGIKGVRITTAVGFYTEVSVPAFSKIIPKGQVEALFYIPDGKVAAIASTALYIGDNAYANGFSESIQFTNSGCNQHPGYYTLAPDPVSSPADTVRTEWAVLAGAPVWASTTMTSAKLRITPTAGMSAVVELFGIWANGSHSLPKVVFTADDGYDNVYSTGIPVLEKYGHRLSMAIIGDLIGTAGYMTVAQLKELVGRGHECVVHGPTGGAGSLVDNYSTTAQVLADVTLHRDFLVNNGLSVNNSHKIYVFPQGKYCASRDDNTVLNAINQAGFTAARLANVNQSSIVIGDAGKLPLFIPIIGHTWSATDEAANVARIIAKIQEAATQGRSVVVTYHKFTTGAAAAAIELQASNLELICRAVSDLESAGSMRNATLGELVTEIQAPQ